MTTFTVAPSSGVPYADALLRRKWRHSRVIVYANTAQICNPKLSRDINPAWSYKNHTATDNYTAIR